MKIALAGATGYLGSHIASYLNTKDIKPIVLVRRWDNTFSSKIETQSVLKVDFTNPLSLNTKLLGVDIVISSLGITRQKDNLTYMDVDYQANLNLLKEAKRSGVKKFVYVSALNGDKLKDIKIFEAKEKFVEQLKNSGLDYIVLRPNGFFSDMKDFLEMAKSGRVYLFGDGSKKLNPIHGKDLAKFCIEAIEKYSNKELEVGGPDVFTHKEVAQLAFKLLDKKTKIVYLPDFLRKFILWILPRFFKEKTYGPIQFFLKVMGIDMIAPKYGDYTLESFYKDELNGRKTTI